MGSYAKGRTDQILGGDFNFTELEVDSTTQASLLHGIELEEWHDIQGRFGLVDAFRLLYREQKAHNLHGYNLSPTLWCSLALIILSKLPGLVGHAFEKLSHITSQILSNHDLYQSVKFQHQQMLPSNISKSSFFKADSAILQSDKNIQELESVRKDNWGEELTQGETLIKAI